MREDKVSFKANFQECFPYAFISNSGYRTRSNSLLFFTNIKQYITWNFSRFLTCCLTRYFEWQRKSRKGKHIKSRDIYFQRLFHSAFTVLSNIQIIKRELTSDKINFQFSEIRCLGTPFFCYVLSGRFLLMI